MELPTGVNRRYASIAIFLLATVWIWVAFDRPYTFPTHIPWNIYSNAPQIDRPSDIFDYPPLHAPSIKKLCADTPWNASVVFKCQEPTGSFAEVRNSLLGCVRLAMAAGGSLVVPSIVMKEGFGNSTISGNSTDLGYMFDTEHFVASMSLSCPQMRLYKPGFGIEYEDPKGPINVSPESIINVFDSAKSAGEDWRPTFYNWLPRTASDPNRPIIVHLGDPYLKYPIASDGEAFQQHFGKVLKVRPDVRKFATLVLQKLLEMYDKSVNVKDLMLHNFLLGVYLSTESNVDSLSEDRRTASYEAQSKLFLGHSMRKNISLIYVGSQHSSEVPRFIQDANADEIAAASKFELLKGKDRGDLLQLTLDQQAMVDFLVMTKVSEFIGVGYDSFAWSVALRRHEYLKKGTGAAWMSGHYVAKDPFSTLIGAAGGYQEFADSMWP